MKLQNIILLLIILFCLVLLLMKINIIETFDDTTSGEIIEDKKKKNTIRRYKRSIRSVPLDDENKLTDSYDENVLNNDYNEKIKNINTIKRRINNRINRADELSSLYTIDKIGIIAYNETQYDNVNTIVNNKINYIEKIYS